MLKLYSGAMIRKTDDRICSVTVTVAESPEQAAEKFKELFRKGYSKILKEELSMEEFTDTFAASLELSIIELDVVEGHKISVEVV